MSTGLFRFRSPLLTESRLISIPPVTEMFQFTGFALMTYVFSHEYRRSGGFPHSESLSQATTSFIAFCRQGIHHVRLFT